MSVMQPSNTLSTARFYHSLGFNILPWRHGDKGGCILSEWQQYNAVRVTAEQIEKWFTDDVGIAIITGRISGITVIDDDLRTGEKRFESSAVARTGGGGFHYFYKYQSGVRSTINTEAHVDILNDGKLVFAYPTIHKSGKRYEWETGLESLRNLQDFPQNHPLLAQINTKSEIDKREKNARLYAHGYDEYVNQSTGGRDTMLKDFCLEMWKKGMSEAQVYSLAKLVNKTYAPPLDDATVWQKVRSTFRGLGVKQDFTIKAVKPTETPSPLISYSGLDLESAYTKKMVACGEGISTGFADLDKYFKLFPQHLYMVTAGTHIGKTTFAMSIATKVAMQGRRVTMFALEDGLFVVPKIKHITKDIPDTFTLVDCESFPTPSQIMAHILENDTDFVVIDHIHFLSSDNPKESIKETIIDITKNLKLLTKKLNIPIMSLVHIRKQEKIKDTPPLIDDMKDAQELGGLANVVCILHRKRLEAGADGYFDNVGTINIAKAKVPNGRLGTLSFSISDEIFNTSPYQSQLSKVLEGYDREAV